MPYKSGMNGCYYTDYTLFPWLGKCPTTKMARQAGQPERAALPGRLHMSSGLGLTIDNADSGCLGCNPKIIRASIDGHGQPIKLHDGVTSALFQLG